MKASEALIAWTPTYSAMETTRGQVKIGPLDQGGLDWTRHYAFTAGAAFTARRRMSSYEQIAAVFIDFNTMVVRDGIEPLVAHEAFLAIDEYAEQLAPDVQGARDPLDEDGPDA